MGFLSPLLLALGAAVAVPLLLHLIQRQQGPRLTFPALRYLRRAEKENARRIRLRQLLLLALRAAAVLLLAVAAARPFVRWGGDEHEPTAVAIVLDNSLSTGLVVGDRRVLDMLEERALETLALAGPDDRFWLIRAASPWEAAPPGDAAATAARVRATAVTGAAADLTAAVDRARSLLAAGAAGRAREVHVLTDLQATNVGRAIESPDDAPPVLVWAPTDEPPPNAAVDAVQVGGGLPPLADARSSVTASIGGAAGGDSLDVRLVVDGRVSGVGRAPPGATAVLPFPARPVGRLSGWVEIDPDALRGDDRRYFVASVRPPPTVALASPSAFIDEALAVLEDAGRLRRGAAGGADIVIAPGAMGIDAARRGRAVVVLPPANTLELPATNRRLASAGVPWRFRPPTGGGEARIALDETSDALLRTLEDVRLRESYGLVPETGGVNDSVLVRLRDGGAWAVRGELSGGGRYVLVGTAFTAEASTLPESAAMLPLVDRLVGAWTLTPEPAASLRPGESVALPTAADAVRTPGGVRTPVPSGGRYRAPARPGLYEVLDGDSVLSAFAVNPPPAESRLARLEDSALRAALPGWRIDLVRDPDGWSDAVYVQRLGREAWRPLALIALAILLIEGLVATAGRRTSSSTGPEPVESTDSPHRPEPPRSKRPRVAASRATGTDRA